MSTVQVHVQRDHGTEPGAETWLDLGPDVVFLLSAEGSAPEGGAALERALRYFTGCGEWQRGGRGDGALPIRSTWTRTDAMGRCVSLRSGLDGEVEGRLHPDYFLAETVDALGAALGECFDGEWVSYAAARRLREAR